MRRILPSSASVSWPLSTGIAGAAAVAERRCRGGRRGRTGAARRCGWRLSGVADAEDRFADRRAAVWVRAERVDVDVTFGAAGRRRAGVGGVDAARAVEVGRRCDREQSALGFAAADQGAEVERAAWSRPAPLSITLPCRSTTSSRSGLSRVGGDVDRLRRRLPTGSSVAAVGRAAARGDADKQDREPCRAAHATPS